MTSDRVSNDSIKDGTRVEKFTGEARWFGTVLSTYTTGRGKVRHVVEVEPQGFQMIAVPEQLRPAPVQSLRSSVTVGDDRPGAKALEWVKDRYGQWSAQTIFGKSQQSAYHVSNYGEWIAPGSPSWADVGDVDQAKAAAQSDFEQRILSTLEPRVTVTDAVTSPSGMTVNNGILHDAQFLVDRLDDFERDALQEDDGEYVLRQFGGHVSPAIERLRAALTAALSEPVQEMQELPPPAQTVGDSRVVAWQHPTAGWPAGSFDEVRVHCQKDGPDPSPLVTLSSLETAERENERLKSERQAMADFVRPRIPADQNPDQAEIVFAWIGMILRLEQRGDQAITRAETAEASLAASIERAACEVDAAWRAKGGLNCTEVCAIIRGAALAGSNGE